MQTKESIIEIVSNIKYLNWKFYIGSDNDKFYLQCKFTIEDSYTKILNSQSGRKWYLSLHMTKNEIVQTAFKAVLTAIEHEARESFLYKEERIFGPHYDIEELVNLCKNKKIDIRK
jgi:hypothetical protein